MSSRLSKFGVVLAAVKGKSLRDGLRPPLTAAPPSALEKSGRDEEMSPQSNKEMPLTTPLTAFRPIQVPLRAAAVRDAGFELLQSSLR